MVSFATRIQTTTNTAMSTTLPRFATIDEARRYGRWLAKKEYLHVLAHESFETAGPVNAMFPRGSRSMKWTRDEG